MSAFWTTAMLGAGGVMLWSTARYKKGHPRMKGIATASVGIVLGCALMNSLSNSNPDWIEIEAAYGHCRAAKLATHLAEKYPNSRALIIRHKHQEDATRQDRIDPMHEAILDGLRQGFGDAIEIAAVVAPRMPEELRGKGVPEAPEFEMELPPEMWFTAALFDEMIDKHAGKCDIVISTIGLPTDFREMAFWHKPSRPKLAILNAPVHERDLRIVLEKRLVAGVVHFRPDAVMDQKMPPSDLDEAFAKRYILITPENVKTLAERFPDQLFVN